MIKSKCRISHKSMFTEPIKADTKGESFEQSNLENKMCVLDFLKQNEKQNSI